MGVVYRATQLSLDRTVALKVIAPHYADDDQFRERFLREAKLAASIDHPNVAPVHEAGEIDGVPYLIMGFIAGEDLGDVLAREGNLAPERAVTIIVQVGAALEAAHERGLVHRDVKPANIMLTRGRDGSERAYLTDFGLTRPPERTNLTQAGQFIGTPDYMAPEQLQDGAITSRVDVYSLGCVLYEMLTGEIPFPSETTMRKLWAHVNGAVPQPSQRGAPPAFDAVIARALAKNPDERYATPSELARDAMAAVASAGDTAPHTAPLPVAPAPPTIAAPQAASTESTAATAVLPPATRRRSAGRIALVVGGVALLAGGALGGILLAGRDDSPTAGPGTTTSAQSTGSTTATSETTPTTTTPTETTPPPTETTPTPPPPLSPSEDTFRAVLNAYERAYTREDAATLASLFAGDVTRRQIASDGKEKGWSGIEDVVGEYERQFDQNENLVYRVDVGKFQQVADGVQVFCRYEIDPPSGDTIFGDIDFLIVPEGDGALIADIEVRPDARPSS